MMTTTEHGEAMEITTVVIALMERYIDLSFELFKVSDELDTLENMLLSLIEDLQFDTNRSHIDVSGNNELLYGSFSIANKLSPTVDLLRGMGLYDQKLVIISGRYGMRENDVSCVIIKELVLTNGWLNIRYLQLDPATFFPDSKHRAISFNSTETVGVGGIGKTNSLATEYQDNEILPRRGSVIDVLSKISLLMKFVMNLCLFAGALLHLLPQRTISGGGGQVSVLFQGLPVPAALQSLFVMNISLALSAAYGDLLVGSNSRTLKAFYTYFAVVFVAAAGGILAYAFICLPLSK